MKRSVNFFVATPIPDDYRALLAAKRNAFMHKGTRAVAHGGISIEEVIVPFVRIQEAP